MQTRILPQLLASEDGRLAEAVLRSCVHCGFCTAVCPTYQLLGDELDGPRGRIYLIKDLLEGEAAGEKTRLHLDRCLSCRACESACPSGVQYHHLLSLGRERLEASLPRPFTQRLLRRALLALLPYRHRFNALLRLGRMLRPLLPARLRPYAATSPKMEAVTAHQHKRTLLLLTGCVQPGLAPEINNKAVRILDRLGIAAIEAGDAGCCGALHHHLGENEQALALMRANIDAWWPHLENGAEAIVGTASACVLEIKEYGEMLANDADYAEKAARVSSLARDISEVLAGEDLSSFKPEKPARIAWHAPCTLEHGLGLNDVVAGMLQGLGYALTPVGSEPACCGSAGAYSLLQPELAQQLLEGKLDALQAGEPGLIATANIGCLKHLQTRASVPVRHWLELLEAEVR